VDISDSYLQKKGCFIKEDDFLVFDLSNEQTYNKSGNSDSKLLLNFFYLNKFVDELINSTLITHNIDATRQLIMLSPEKGKMIVPYNKDQMFFSEDLDIKQKYANLAARNHSQEFELLLKDQIFNQLYFSNSSMLLMTLIENIDDILEKTKSSYEIYLNKFSFTKFTENFRKEREEYFSSIREVINQLINKTVSIPISVSAVALGIYNLQGSEELCIIITITFCIYALFTAYLLALNYQDIEEIGLSLAKDIIYLQSTIKIDMEIFGEETDKVNNKLRSAKKSICSIQLILAILIITILFVTFNLLKIEFIYLICTAIVGVTFFL
jgi:hypothetical protein